MLLLSTFWIPPFDKALHRARRTLPPAVTCMRYLLALLVLVLPLSGASAQGHETHLAAPSVAPATPLATPAVYKNESKLPHTVCSNCGHYRGRQVLDVD